MGFASPFQAGTSRYTEAERMERVAHYRDWMAQVYRMLGLDHWELSVKYAPASPDAEAELWRQPGQYQAKLRLSDEWYEDTLEGQRLSLIHEYLHAHMRAYWETCLTVEELVGVAAWHMFGKAIENAEEMVVDGLARALAPLFPLPPPWPPEEKGPLPGVELAYTAVFSDGDREDRKMVLDREAVLALAAALRDIEAKDLPGPEAPPEEPTPGPVEGEGGLEVAIPHEAPGEGQAEGPGLTPTQGSL